MVTITVIHHSSSLKVTHRVQLSPAHWYV